MPVYDYLCKTCGHDFTVIETMREHEGAKATCPVCDSSDVERVIRGVNVQTGKKS